MPPTIAPNGVRSWALIEALQRPNLYPDQVEQVELLETHISWLLLAGSHCYKIKKPVNFGFLDFSSLELRRHFCAEELRLNRRFSPDLYLDLVEVTGTPTTPRFGGPGPAIEYAVRMVRFPDESRLDRVLARGEFDGAACDRLAEAIVDAHRVADVARVDTDYANSVQIERQTNDAFQLAIEGLPTSQRRIDLLRSNAKLQFECLNGQFSERRRLGFVRECHGDLHLENILLGAGGIRLFDCLEFNPWLRWIDVASDLAFVTMDLSARGHPGLASRLLNRYLELTDDYACLRVLAYYQMYRAVVRAGVTGLHGRLAGLKAADRGLIDQRSLDYLRLAEKYLEPPRPLMAITHGFSGAGKSTFTEPLAELLPAIRLRSDVERNRLAEEVSGGTVDRYSAIARRRVYEQMASKCDTILTAGHPVIVDATFLQRADRELFQLLATKHDVPLIILRFTRPPEELRERILGRIRDGSDPSEATITTLEKQKGDSEPVNPAEFEIATVLHISAQSLPQEVAVRLHSLEAARPGTQ